MFFFAPNSFPFSTTLTFDTTSKPFFVAKNKKKKTPGELSPITGPSDRVCFPLVLLLCAYARLYAGLITATATSRHRLNLASHHLVCRAGLMGNPRPTERCESVRYNVAMTLNFCAPPLRIRKRNACYANGPLLDDGGNK